MNTLDLITVTWEIEALPAWRAAAIVILIFAGTLATPIAAGTVGVLGSKRGMSRLARGTLAGLAAVICAAASITGLIALSTNGHETQQKSLRYLEVGGTVSSVSVMATISESDAGPRELGIRLQEHPQLLLLVDGSDVDRYIGTEGNPQTLTCDVPDDLSTVVTLSCSSTAPTPRRGGLANLLGLPSNAKSTFDEDTVNTTRTPIELNR